MTELTGPRTYGNWRRPVQPGIASLGIVGHRAGIRGHDLHDLGVRVARVPVRSARHGSNSDVSAAGLAAASTLDEYVDTFGRRFAFVAYPSTATYAVMLRIDPQGSASVDSDQIDQRVAHYGNILIMAGQEVAWSPRR